MMQIRKDLHVPKGHPVHAMPCIEEGFPFSIVSFFCSLMISIFVVIFQKSKSIIMTIAGNNILEIY